MQKSLIYFTGPLIAAAAIAIAPIAAADPAGPGPNWCGYGQFPDRDHCDTIAPLPPLNPQPANSRDLAHQEPARCPPGAIEVSEGICAPPPAQPPAPQSQPPLNH
jgi:hypothetical protein